MKQAPCYLGNPRFGTKNEWMKRKCLCTERLNRDKGQPGTTRQRMIWNKPEQVPRSEFNQTEICYQWATYPTPTPTPSICYTQMCPIWVRLTYRYASTEPTPPSCTHKHTGTPTPHVSIPFRPRFFVWQHLKKKNVCVQTFWHSLPLHGAAAPFPQSRSGLQISKP